MRLPPLAAIALSSFAAMAAAMPDVRVVEIGSGGVIVGDPATVVFEVSALTPFEGSLRGHIQSSTHHLGELSAGAPRSFLILLARPHTSSYWARLSMRAGDTRRTSMQLFGCGDLPHAEPAVLHWSLHDGRGRELSTGSERCTVDRTARARVLHLTLEESGSPRRSPHDAWESAGAFLAYSSVIVSGEDLRTLRPPQRKALLDATWMGLELIVTAPLAPLPTPIADRLAVPAALIWGNDEGAELREALLGMGIVRTLGLPASSITGPGSRSSPLGKLTLGPGLYRRGRPPWLSRAGRLVTVSLPSSGAMFRTVAVIGRSLLLSTLGASLLLGLSWLSSRSPSIIGASLCVPLFIASPWALYSFHRSHPQPGFDATQEEVLTDGRGSAVRRRIVWSGGGGGPGPPSIQAPPGWVVTPGLLPAAGPPGTFLRIEESPAGPIIQADAVAVASQGVLAAEMLRVEAGDDLAEMTFSESGRALREITVRRDLALAILKYRGFFRLGALPAGSRVDVSSLRAVDLPSLSPAEQRLHFDTANFPWNRLVAQIEDHDNLTVAQAVDVVPIKASVPYETGPALRIFIPDAWLRASGLLGESLRVSEKTFSLGPVHDGFREGCLDGGKVRASDERWGLHALDPEGTSESQ